MTQPAAASEMTVMKNNVHLRYATRSVPRYTSYPTAPHFNAEVNGTVYAEWLAALPADASVSLYLHVPYCRSICHYCGCHTKAALRDDPVIEYAETLAAEINLVADTIGRKAKVTHIHWGGGTPSLLPEASFDKVMAAIRARFDLTGLIEHATELDPRTVTADLARSLAGAGVTRASLGVQDFDADVQVAIGRVQPFEVVEAAVGFLRAAGITALNFDLMYGLPRQSAESIRETVRLATLLAPTRLALFGYAHVPWFKKHQRLIDEAALPGATERMALEDIARQALADAGFLPVGLDHFARADDAMAKALAAGELKRNFQGYTTDDADTLIGLGASSIGRMPQGFVQNNPDIGGWRRSVEAGELPAVKGKALDADDRLRADLIERLMCDYRVDLREVCARHGVSAATLADGVAQLDELERDGLLIRDGDSIAMTTDGRPFVRIAAAAFDVYLARAAARHSLAV